METVDTVKCDFCDTVATMEHALDTGWTPSYWLDAHTEGKNPVCPTCSRVYLDQDADDGPMLKPPHKRNAPPNIEWFIGVAMDGTRNGSTTIYAVVRMRDGTHSVTTARVDDFGGEPVVVTTRMPSYIFDYLRLAPIVPNVLRAELFDAILEAI